MFKKLMVALPLVAALSGTAFAQDSYPDKSIRLVHGFGPGGNADTVSRIIAEAMSEGLGQPVVVESKPGAGGTVASDYVSKSDPDGYTMQLLVGGHAVAAALYNKLPYDTLGDYTYISTIGQFPFFVATQTGKFESIEDLIEQAKAAPGTLKIGHSGVGSTQHLTGELLDLSTGAKFIHIPYKGGAAAATALLGGEVDVLIDTGTVISGQAEGGAFDILAVTSDVRWPGFDDVPTLDETVAPGTDVVSWTGIGMPAGVPEEIVAKVSAEMQRIMALPGVQEKVETLGAKPGASSNEELLDMVQSQIETWTKVVESAGVPKR
ncbi:MAG: tripartite tricarboxylate transporter substrate-binding protein [Celeribacter sp.]|jgi:tripartite-type tricarboxylate transporter receptor subunit TctC